MKPKNNRRLRRGISLLPGMLTVGNLLCGYYAILSAASGTPAGFDNAAKAIGIAVVLDGLDGRVARMTGSTSAFGKEFDSLADVVSFGIAPAFLALLWGLRPLDPASASSPDLVKHIYQLGWIVSFAFVLGGAWRLARFNLQPADSGHIGHPGHRFFLGMPIPGAAGVVAAIVHYFKEPITQWYWGAAWLVLVASLAFLMVSHLRYYSFKDIDLGRRRPSVILVVVGLFIWSLVDYSEEVLLAIASIYFLSGLIALARRRLMGAMA
jgi:CDP-diacylglycerol--serine O-phosphatidyltransferase